MLCLFLNVLGFMKRQLILDGFSALLRFSVLEEEPHMRARQMSSSIFSEGRVNGACRGHLVLWAVVSDIQ